MTNTLPTGLTLAAVKEHLRVDYHDDDFLIQRCMDAALIDVLHRAQPCDVNSALCKRPLNMRTAKPF